MQRAVRLGVVVVVGELSEGEERGVEGGEGRRSAGPEGYCGRSVEEGRGGVVLQDGGAEGEEGWMRDLNPCEVGGDRLRNKRKEKPSA